MFIVVKYKSLFLSSIQKRIAAVVND